MVTATYAVQVDWNNDGVFTGTGEDVTARVRSDPGLKKWRGKDHFRLLAPPAAGGLEFELDNQSRDYSPENAGSPLFGNLVPGRTVRVQATYNATTYSLFQGIIDDLAQNPEPLRKSVTVPAYGVLSRLRGKKISTALYSNIATDTALGVIFDAAGWPAGDRTFDTGKTTMLWWWLDAADAFDAAMALVNTEGPGATLWEDGQGKAHFESRQYRLLTPRCTTSQATFRDQGAEPLHSAPFVYNPGLKDIVNLCTVQVKTRSAKALSAVWSLGQTVTLGAAEVRSYQAKGSDPFQAAVCVAGTDYTVSAGSATVTLDRTSGASCTVTLTAGASGATITGLQVRAQTVSVDTTTQVSSTIDTSASQTAYGKRTYTLAVLPEISVNVGQDFCNAVVSAYKDPRPYLAITVNNGADARMTQVLTREISDRITIIEAQTGMNADCFVEHVRHTVRQGGTEHIATFGCEKAPTSGAGGGGSFWILGDAVLGVLGTTTILGY